MQGVSLVILNNHVNQSGVYVKEELQGWGIRSLWGGVLCWGADRFLDLNHWSFLAVSWKGVGSWDPSKTGFSEFLWSRR